MSEVQQNVCDTCSQIICKECHWVASKASVRAIREGTLTSCPICGWEPDGALRTLD